MKIAYNPKTGAALTTAPANNDITFDLRGLNIFVRGEKFKGTDTTYSVFKKHTSTGSGGYNGLVPVPSYTSTNIRFLREDGTWKSIDNYLYIQITDQDLDTLITEGKWYYAGGGNSVTNKPNGVGAFELYVGRNSGSYRYLKLITHDGIIWFRYYNASSWSSWVRWYTDQNTDLKVLQSATTTANFRPLILGYNNSTDKSVLANDTTNLVYTTTSIYVQPSTGSLWANKFIGKIDWSNIEGKPSSFTPTEHQHEKITHNMWGYYDAISDTTSPLDICTLFKVDASGVHAVFTGIVQASNGTRYQSLFWTGYGAAGLVELTKSYGYDGRLKYRISNGWNDNGANWSTAGYRELANVEDLTWTNIKSKPETAIRWPSWSEVTEKPSTFTPSSHTHSTALIITLTNYTKATAIGSIATTDTLNTALGKLEFKTDFIYNDLFGTDNDNVINKWHEIVDFIDSVKEGTDILDEFVTRKTALVITGQKNFNTNTGVTPVIISRLGSPYEAVAIKVYDNQAIFEYTNDEKENFYIFQMINTDTELSDGSGANASQVLFTGNSAGSSVTATTFIGKLNNTLTFSAGTFAEKTYNNSSAVTVNIPTHTSHLVNNSGFLTLHQSLANYVTLDTALTITGVKTFSASPILTYNTCIILNLADTSHYSEVIKWLKGDASLRTYDPSIGQHNTGGDGTGSICILPYPTEIDPWNGSVGLFIRKDHVYIDNKELANTANGSAYFTAFSGGEITSSGNALTQTSHSITIGGQTKTAGASTCNIINSLSVSTITSSATTNLTLGLTVNGVVSTNKTIPDLYAASIRVKDVRGDTRLTTYWEDRTANFWFNWVGTPSPSWYSGITIKGWTDDYLTWELASGSTNSLNGNLYYRNGLNGTWLNWLRIMFASELPGLFTDFSNAGSLTTSISIGGTTKTLKIDADMLDGLHSSSFLKHRGFWYSQDNHSADGAPTGMYFAYPKHGVPESWGTLVTFAPSENSGYNLQLHGTGNNNLYYRTRSEDMGQKPWKRLADADELKDPASYYWADVPISATSSATTSPTFHSATATQFLSKWFGGVNTTNGGLFGDASTIIGSGYTGAIVYSYGDAPIWFHTGSKLRMLLDKSGNLGIGNDSPVHKLSVSGDIYTTTGFKKNGSSDSYVLLGGGGHKAVADFAPSGHTHLYIATTSFKSSGETVADYKTSIHSALSGSTGIGKHIVVSDSIIRNWGNDSASYTPSSVSSIININGGYDGLYYGQFLVSSWAFGLGLLNYGRGFQNIQWFIHSGNIGTQSVNYANSAGNAATATDADTVDGYHASGLVKFYLSPMSSNAPADSAKSWFVNTMPSGSGAIVYNVLGREKTIIAGKSTSNHGHMLQLNYDDNYLRILRYKLGSWQSTDWEKISAGYADSAATALCLAYNRRMDYGWNGLNYFNISGPAGTAVKENNTPTTTWWHILRFNHADSSGYYTDLAIPFNDNSLYYKRVRAGVLADGKWVRMLDELNYTTYINPANFVTSLGTNGNYVTWTKNGTTNNLTVPYASYAGYLQSHDTRSVDNTPGLFSDGARFQFKQNSVDGLNDGGTYHGILHFKPYGSASDFSGGLTHLLGFTDNGNLYMRTSTSSTTWGSWRLFVNSENYTGIVLKIGTATKGSATLPIYLNEGTPTACSSTLGVSITGNAATATDADTVDGYHATCGSNKPWGTIPVITVGGWMDVGKQFEFHYDNTTGSDYSTILRCTGNHSNIVNLPSASGTLALTSQIPTSLPASDVYDWAKQPTKPSYSFSEITPGVATIGDGTNRLMFRINASWSSGMYHSTPGNESMVFANINPVTSWIFANTNPTANTDWTTLTPSLQIKNGRVTINKLISNNTDAPYNLDVNGSANATTLYENGVRVSVSGHTHNYLPLSGGTMNQGSHIVFPGTSTDASYGGSIEFREVDYVATNQTDWSYAPGITFHWGGRSVGKLGLRSDGDLAWRDLSIIHSGNISSQSVNYANSAGYTKRLYANSISDLTTRPGDYSLAYSRFQAGVSNIFPTINNANGVITAHLHYGDYFAQIGLSSDGRMYYRTMMDLTLDAGVTWNKVAWTTDIPTKVSQLTNDSGFITGGPYLPLTGGTLTGSLTVGDKDANEIISIAGNTSHLKMMAHTNATYIESGNKDWNGNTHLLITGYSGNQGSNLYLYFANIYCRNNSYVNLDSGNWASYITIPTATSQLTNDSGFLTSRGYIGRTTVLATAAALSLTGIGNITPETASTYYLGASDKPWYLIFCRYFTSDLVSLSSSSNSGSLAYSSTSGYFYITANNIAANTSGGFVMKTVKNGVLSLIVLESASDYGQIRTTGDLYIGGRSSNTTALISSDALHNMYVSVQGKILLVCNSSEESIRCGIDLAGKISLGTASCPWEAVYSKLLCLKGSDYTSKINPNPNPSPNLTGELSYTLPSIGGTLLVDTLGTLVKGWVKIDFSYDSNKSSTGYGTYSTSIEGEGSSIYNYTSGGIYYPYFSEVGILLYIPSLTNIMYWGFTSNGTVVLLANYSYGTAGNKGLRIYCKDSAGNILTSGSGTLFFIKFN